LGDCGQHYAGADLGELDTPLREVASGGRRVISATAGIIEK
jgi:hypothetical protein